MYLESPEAINRNSIRHYLQYVYGGDVFESDQKSLERVWNVFLGRKVLLDLSIYPGSFNLVEEGLYFNVANYLRRRGFKLKPKIPLQRDSLVSPSGMETITDITTGLNSARIKITELNRMASY